MQKARNVKLTEDTLNGLEEMGKPFESVNQCIQRLLAKNCVSVSKTNNKETEEEGDESES